MKRFPTILLVIRFSIIPLSAIPEATVTKSISVFAKGGLRMRDQPGISGKIIALIPHLSQIDIQLLAAPHSYIKGSEYWLKAKYQAKEGFVSSKYVNRVLKKIASPTGKFDLFQLGPFFSEGDWYEPETTVTILTASGEQVFSQNYWNVRQMFWLDDAVAVIRVYSGENVMSFSGTYKIDTQKGKAEIARIISSEGFGGPQGECTEEPGCVCFIEENKSYGRLFYLTEKPPISIFRVKGEKLAYKNKHKNGNICKVVEMKDLNLIKAFPEGKKLKIDGDYYEGIKFSVDDKNYLIPGSKDDVLEVP